MFNRTKIRTFSEEIHTIRTIFEKKSVQSIHFLKKSVQSVQFLKKPAICTFQKNKTIFENIIQHCLTQPPFPTTSFSLPIF